MLTKEDIDNTEDYYMLVWPIHRMKEGISIDELNQYLECLDSNWKQLYFFVPIHLQTYIVSRLKELPRNDIVIPILGYKATAWVYEGDQRFLVGDKAIEIVGVDSLPHKETYLAFQDKDTGKIMRFIW